MEIPSMRPETRYGMPAADHLLMNRGFITGYSYLLRQPVWALQLIDAESAEDNVKRKDAFRPDYRIPEMFRADLDDFKYSGYDRGHLVSSADARASKIMNSETFLLSNMVLQDPALNRGKWAELEQSVRDLAAMPRTLEVYVVSGVAFNVYEKFKLIGKGNSRLVLPHYFFKSVLAENDRGTLDIWTFLLPNRGCNAPLHVYRVPTDKVERMTGLVLWGRLQDSGIREYKARIHAMW